MVLSSRAAARRYADPVCPRCSGALIVEYMVGGSQSCPHCNRPFEAMPFLPPEPRTPVGRVAEAGPEGAVPCAQHAGNAAVANCSRCGVFMCALCRVQIDGRVLCPACFDRLAAQGELPSARNRVRNYRGMALLAGLGGCWFYVLGLLTGPVTLYLAVQAQRQRRRLEESDGLLTIILVWVLGLSQIVGSLFGIASLVTNLSHSVKP